MSENNENVVRLDVRPLLSAGHSPLGAIMDAVQQLTDEQSLLVVAPFEPFPLYQMLGEYGYSHKTTALDDGSWEILFSPVR